MKKKKIVILTGAGISAESGLKTFRDSDGLWENYNIQDVATPEAWDRNPELVQRFYNERRQDVAKAKPNAAHKALAKLEQYYDVTIITQNIDDLHERGGSNNVVHLHGIITKSQSCANPNLVYNIEGDEIKMGELCEFGSQLRPHVVWFGEDVPNMNLASQISKKADIFIVCGTSLSVYPAASIAYDLADEIEKYIVDVNISPEIESFYQFKGIKDTAVKGLPKLVKKLNDKAKKES